jgi:hypothetical protein
MFHFEESHHCGLLVLDSMLARATPSSLSQLYELLEERVGLFTELDEQQSSTGQRTGQTHPLLLLLFLLLPPQLFTPFVFGNPQRAGN